MALIYCPECNKEVSDKALSCPHCGMPLGSEATSQEPPQTWKPGVAAVLSLVIPGAGQMYEMNHDK
jgi:predicted amidophosphoribosyltransferase